MAEVRMLHSSTFFSIVESLCDAVLIVDAGLEIIYCNQAVHSGCGYSKEELVGQSLAAIMPLFRNVDTFSQSFHGTNYTIEAQMVVKDGWSIPVHVSRLILEEGEDLAVLVIKDITQRKRTEHRLMRSQQLGHVGSWERDTKNGVLYWSDEMFRICGIEPKEPFTVAEFLEQYVHPDDVEKVRCAMAMADSGDVYDMQYRVIRPDGEIRWLHAQGELELTGDAVSSVLGCVKDITLYKQSVDDLRRSKDNLKLAQKLARLGHWDWDIRNDNIFWSDETYVIAGQEPGEFGKTYESFLELVHPEDRMHVNDRIRRALNGEEFDVEYRLLRANGAYCVLHVIGKVYRDTSGNPIRLFGTCQDITDKRRTEEMLINSEKLAVAGQLAAGFAHEIRNPLTALKGFTQLLRSQAHERDIQFYEIMTNELERIATIVDNLLLLAKPQSFSTKPIEINSLIEDVVALLKPQAAIHNVAFHINFNDVFVVDCEPNQIKQVFVNIVKNAIEAMPAGGVVTVRLQCTGHMLTVQFCDQGAGIPRAVVSKLGEPFYTTKQGGTGLGLMVSQKIVLAHRGMMDIQSEVGMGTTVSVVLPLHMSSVSAGNR